MENDSGQVEDWRMLRLTFGVASSPFLATRVLREAASIYRDEFPRAAAVIDTCLYVDDCILAVDTISDAISLRVELNSLLSRIGMVLRKWRSSSTAVTDSIPPDLRERETSQLLAGPRDHHKTLGIHWDTGSDSLLQPRRPSCTQPSDRWRLRSPEFSTSWAGSPRPSSS